MSLEKFKKKSRSGAATGASIGAMSGGVTGAIRLADELGDVGLPNWVSPQTQKHWAPSKSALQKYALKQGLSRAAILTLLGAGAGGAIGGIGGGLSGLLGD